MLKSEYFISATKAGLHLKLGWCISAFAETQISDEWKADPFVGRIVHQPDGYYVVDEQAALVKIDDSEPGRPLFSVAEKILLKAGDIPNLAQDVETTYGDLFFNWVAIVYAFDAKIPYLAGRTGVNRVCDIYVPKLEDDVEEGQTEDPNRFYVREHLKFAEAIAYLRGMSQLFVWSVTRKTMLPPPGLKEYKQQLLKENAGKLNDLTTIADIKRKLAAFDAEWLKGDPGGEKFLSGKKAREVVRMKKLLIHGEEVGMQENAVTGVLVENSLLEGWDIDKFPSMMDSLRSGSYNRGQQTALGGVSVKWLLRATSNLRITEDDCGSQLGFDILIDRSEINQLVGQYILEEGKVVEIADKEHAGSYLGKVVSVRNPQMCRLSHTDFCRTCLGKQLSINEYGLSSSSTEVASGIMGIFMGAMHGKQLATERMVIEDAFH